VRQLDDWSTSSRCLAFASSALPRQLARKTKNRRGKRRSLSGLDRSVFGLYVAQSRRAATQWRSGHQRIVERRVYAVAAMTWTSASGKRPGSCLQHSRNANLIAYKDNLRYGLGAGYSLKSAIGRGKQRRGLRSDIRLSVTRGKNPLSGRFALFFVSGPSNETGRL